MTKEINDIQDVLRLGDGGHICEKHLKEIGVMVPTFGWCLGVCEVCNENIEDNKE